MRCFFLSVLLACTASINAEEYPSVWDGIFTDVQAERGKVVFLASCLACHANEPGQVASHGAAPSVIGEDFRFRWVDSSVADLVDTVRQTMPEAAPNSLSSEQYADVVAYMLALNGYPSGAVELDLSKRDLLFDTYIDAEAP